MFSWKINKEKSSNAELLTKITSLFFLALRDLGIFADFYNVKNFFGFCDEAVL